MAPASRSEPTIDAGAFGSSSAHARSRAATNSLANPGHDSAAKRRARPRRHPARDERSLDGDRPPTRTSDRATAGPASHPLATTSAAASVSRNGAFATRLAIAAEVHQRPRRIRRESDLIPHHPDHNPLHPSNPRHRFFRCFDLLRLTSSPHPQRRREWQRAPSAPAAPLSRHRDRVSISST